MGLVLSIGIGFCSAFIFALFIYWLDRFEKEPGVLLGGVFIWGAFVAGGTAFLVNTVLGLGIYIFTGSEEATELTTGSLVAPIVEETLKGLAVLLVFLVMRHEFDSILDGMVYAGITALGFAASENSYYIYSKGYLPEGYLGLTALTFIRVVLVGWQHPFYTAFIGIGLALARLNRGCLIRISAPIAGWMAAVITHAFHNILASYLQGLGGLLIGSFIDWTGWLVMFGFVLWMIRHEKKLLERYLKDEVTAGTITPGQYAMVISQWNRVKTQISALGRGQVGNTGRFFQACGKLAHKRNQFARLGDEEGNLKTIAELRAEISRLSAQIA